LWEQRRLLPVSLGERGLRQSQALFLHVRDLPELLAEVPSEMWQRLAGVGVSVKPRDRSDSYMPVFLAGQAVAEAVARARGIPLVSLSHQAGHVMAGLISCRHPELREFFAFHISGGTTELLRVSQAQPGHLLINILGASTDLHAGQFIDRVGVALGLEFPAGAALEELALTADPQAASLLPAAVQGGNVSFSGVESAATRLIKAGAPPADVALAVQGALTRSLAKMLKSINIQEKLPILMVGGVAQNKYLRHELPRRVNGAQFFWAEPQWSEDNAMGVAALCALKLGKVKQYERTAQSCN
jgi:N6-L-threonylcarbamoyladenine synthase